MANNYFIAGIRAAFNRGRGLFEGGVYFFQYVILAWPLPRLNAALMIVPHLPVCIATRQHFIYAHARISRHTVARI